MGETRRKFDHDFREGLSLSRPFPCWRLFSGRVSGAGPELLSIAAGHGVGAGRAQDYWSVRIYSSELSPRQDSNLRSRLRRGLLCTALTSGNEWPHAMIGGGPGATAGRGCRAGTACHLPPPKAVRRARCPRCCGEF